MSPRAGAAELQGTYCGEIACKNEYLSDAPMSRFYFHVRDGDMLTRDFRGTDLEDADAVRFQARCVARDLLAQVICADMKINGREIVVENDQGMDVLHLP